jgi:hypothetical protein
VASEGPNSSGTLANDTAVGNLGWSNATNAGASDNSYATFVADGKVTDSQYLKSTNFSFSIPNGATIDGVEVAIERKASSDGSTNVRDLRVRLVKGGTVQSAEDKAVTGTDWPTTDGTASYGGSSDMWSNSWTRAEINASDFGVVLQAAGTGVVTGSVDHITITVTYTPSTATALPKIVAAYRGRDG